MNSEKHLVAYWLFSIALLVIIMIAIGGYTRLTNSGLSIVEWKPATGIFYPISEESWQIEFNKYKNSPEYQLINFDMNIEGFKEIYFVEYFHRLFGRILGLLFIIPLIFFSWKHYLRKQDLKKLLGIFFLGAIQGGVGWYMVRSGLNKDPHVSHFRLSFHLLMGIFIFSAIFWQGLNYYKNQFDQKLFANTDICLLLITLIIQIFYGGLVAGLDAGLIYNEFPMMGDGLMPSELYRQESFADILFYNPATVQFIHRLIAFIFLISAFFILKKHLWQKSILTFFSLATLQITLGIFTVINNVPLNIALLHQIMAVGLISNLLFILHSLIYDKS